MSYKKFKFTGKERDACPSVANEMQRRRDESGYDYFEARLYDSDFGRFLQFDPLASDPMQLDKSPYAYTWNNPINLTDPDGKRPWTTSSQGQFNLAIMQYQADVENFFNGVSSSISKTANSVGSSINDAYNTVANLVPNLFVDGNIEGEYFEPNKDAIFNVVIEKEDMEIIKQAAGAVSKPLRPNLGPSEKRASSTADKYNQVQNDNPTIGTVTKHVIGADGDTTTTVTLNQSNNENDSTIIIRPDEDN